MFKTIKLENFGIHTSTEIDFTPGINCIIGPNRSGKTQLLESISFALFGKTQNSKLEKIINFNADKASVQLSLDTLEITRHRGASSSTLSGITKQVLEHELNLDYSEFLSLFYMSSHEQNSLFDSTYLRKFLLSVFDLEKYATTVQKLKIEYKTLKDIDTSIKERNKDILKSRFKRVRTFLDKLNPELEKYQAIQSKLSENTKEVYGEISGLKSKAYDINRQMNLLRSGKCSQCQRPFDKNHKQELLKLTESHQKIQGRIQLLMKKQKSLEEKQEKCSRVLIKLQKLLNRVHRILGVIQTKAKQKTPVVDLKRMRTLEQVIPILEPKGFPSYLLNIYVPVITETANQLLASVFPDTCVDIRTEKPESNKPDFKPFIKRGENTLELQELSGSERILVNLCFRLGVLIIFKRLHTTCIDTLLWDEGFGKIDDENTLKILSLLNSCINMGFLKQIIIVTHKDILKNQENINYIRLGGSNGN